MVFIVMAFGPIAIGLIASGSVAFGQMTLSQKTFVPSIHVLTKFSYVRKIVWTVFVSKSLSYVALVLTIFVKIFVTTNFVLIKLFDDKKLLKVMQALIEYVYLQGPML